MQKSNFTFHNIYVILKVNKRKKGDLQMHDIQIKNLSFSYEEGSKLILKDINVDVNAGEFVCILGQSGCGKSTLLRLLAGLEKPTTGELLINGEPIKGASLKRGVVFQDYGLFPWMTAGENILLALKQCFPEKVKSELQQIAMDMIKAVGLDESVYKKFDIIHPCIYN